MAAKIIDGKQIAAQIRAELQKEVEELKSKQGLTPGLAVVLVGENPASQVYMLKESLSQMPALLQHLAVLIRGFGRVGNIVDLALLNDIKSRQQEFIELADDARHDALIKRIVGWIDAAEKEINLRNQ